MFEDILGEYKENTINSRSVGDTECQSFADIWAAKQKQIDSFEEESEEDYEEDYLQPDYTGI